MRTTARLLAVAAAAAVLPLPLAGCGPDVPTYAPVTKVYGAAGTQPGSPGPGAGAASGPGASAGTRAGGVHELWHPSPGYRLADPAAAAVAPPRAGGPAPSRPAGGHGGAVTPDPVPPVQHAPAPGPVQQPTRPAWPKVTNRSCSGRPGGPWSVTFTLSTAPGHSVTYAGVRMSGMAYLSQIGDVDVNEDFSDICP